MLILLPKSKLRQLAASSSLIHKEIFSFIYYANLLFTFSYLVEVSKNLQLHLFTHHICSPYIFSNTYSLNFQINIDLHIAT